MVTDQSRTLEALQTAIQMEIDGKTFYLEASQASGNDTGRKLFQSLAEEEDMHRRKFEGIFKAIQAQKAWPQVEIVLHDGRELRTVLSEASENVKATTSELEAVQAAIDLENKTYDYYKAQAARALFEAEEYYYTALAGQEQIHRSILLDYSEYLKDPAQYFTMKERHSLDGA